MQDGHGNVEQFKRLATAKGRQQNGRFVIEGIRLHERALRAGVEIERVILTQSFRLDPSPRIQRLMTDLQKRPCPLHIVPEAVMVEMTAGRALGAIMGMIKLPDAPSLAHLIQAQAGKPALFLVGVDIVDPGNVGALIRTGHASGVTAFIAVGVSDPFHPKAVRTTMGSLFRVPILQYGTIDPLLADLRHLDVLTMGTAVTDGTPLPRVTHPQSPVAVLMGNEYHGLPADILAGVDRRVSIPMVDGIDSLSVNAATAMILYQLRLSKLK
jgi:TrmH family RNA methyltransferase